MTRIERLFRNRSGTALYTVLRSSEGYSVVEWTPVAGGAEAPVVLSRFDVAPGEAGDQQRSLAIEMARSEAASN